MTGAHSLSQVQYTVAPHTKAYYCINSTAEENRETLHTSRSTDALMGFAAN